MGIKFKIPLCHMAWFETSPDAGHPDCLCSYCGFLIKEDDDPFRIFSEGGKFEIRLHRKCFELVTE